MGRAATALRPPGPSGPVAPRDLGSASKSYFPLILIMQSGLMMIKIKLNLKISAGTLHNSN